MICRVDRTPGVHTVSFEGCYIVCYGNKKHEEHEK